MSPKSIIVIAGVIVALVLGAALLTSLVGTCDTQEYIVVQPIFGEARVQEATGGSLYWKGFAKTWSYPRYSDFRYNDDPAEGDGVDERIRTTFNDGGTAEHGIYIRVGMPLLAEDRINFHEQFAGDLTSVKAAVKAHAINCLKSTAPLMSGSEHQSARKAEFANTVERQLVKGLYAMRKVEKELKDRTDSEGNPITVFATEILEGEDGQAIIAQPSPLTEKFKMTIEQFSVISSDYDAETLQQFAEKKKAYLAAERSKAERESAVQERLMIQEQGLRDKTEAEAIANVDKAKAVIAAELKAEVALQTKIEAETKANQLLEVAKIEKEEAETKASMDLEVAKVQAEAAMENKKAMIAEAEGKQQAIELSGAITELEQAKIDAEVKIMSEFARSIPMMQSPSTVFSGGNGAGNEGSSTLQNNMMSLVMLKMIGGDNFADFGKVKSVSNRQIRDSIPTDTNTEVAKK